LHQAEIECISDCPYDGRNSRLFQAQFGNDFLLVTIAQLRNRLWKSSQIRAKDVLVHLLQSVDLELIDLGESLFQVGRDDEPPVSYIPHMAEQNDTLPGKLMQIQALAAVLAGDLRMGMKLVPRRFQLFDFGIKHPHAREPVVDVLSAIPSRNPAGAADRKVDFSPALIEFLRDLRARLSRADYKDCSIRQRARV